MFLKRLTISDVDGLVRKIEFRPGLNLIVDETPVNGGKETGNSVGKTTALMLVDFCLGGDGKGIYTDPENKRDEYQLVKNFLFEKEVLISLTLSDDLRSKDASETIIERNFLPRNRAIRRVGGKQLTVDGFEECISDLLLPGHYGDKPTFRQIISHNIRYSDSANSNTLKTLDKFTRDDEYETLYLFMLGCDIKDGHRKQMLLSELRAEQSFLARLEKSQTLSGYEAMLVILGGDIAKLNAETSTLNVRSNFSQELDELNEIKLQANAINEEIATLQLRESLIADACAAMLGSKADIDFAMLKQIYSSASAKMGQMHRSFEDLVKFHNAMVEEKASYISRDLDVLRLRIDECRGVRDDLARRERAMASQLKSGVTYLDMEVLIARSNELYRRKGEVEARLDAIKAVNDKVGKLLEEIHDIDDAIFSSTFAEGVQTQVNKFNLTFSAVSEELYGESYALKVDRVTKRGVTLYKFTAFNTNLSSGKKQGEIACFDIAYTLFADEERIPCMHFLLNDKRELMHGNQLVGIASLAEREGIQFVASMLKDKLPPELDKDEYVVARLSQKDKLFRIEDATE